MTDKVTDAANAWLILNDADVVEKKFVDMFDKLFSNAKSGNNNRDLLAAMVLDAPITRMRMQQWIEGEIINRTNDTLKRTLESAEVMIQEDIRTFTPRIAIRFTPMYGGSFTVYPRVNKL